MARDETDSRIIDETEVTSNGLPSFITCKKVASGWAILDPIVINETPCRMKRLALYPEIRINSEGKQVLRAHLVYEPLHTDGNGNVVPIPEVEKIGKMQVSQTYHRKIDLELSSEELSSLINHLNSLELVNKIKLDGLEYCQIINTFSVGDLHELIESNWNLKKMDPKLHGCLLALTDSSTPVGSKLMLLIKSVLKAGDVDIDTDLLEEIMGSLVSRLSQSDPAEAMDLLSVINDKDRRVLSNHLNILELESFVESLSEEITKEHPEEYWQNKFTQNNWVLSQIFPRPMIIYKDKVRIGGQTLEKTGGIVDYLFKNKLTSNVTLIEIKRSSSKIVKDSLYRTGLNTYSMSDELVGGIVQILDYRNTLLNESYGLLRDTEVKTFDPQCVLVIGNLDGLNADQVRSFELYRNNLKSVSVITFDEIIERLRVVLSLFNKKGSD